MVPLSPLTPGGGGVARGSWAKIDDGFDASAVSNLQQSGYNGFRVCLVILSM
jgi:hypothetical protein